MNAYEFAALNNAVLVDSLSPRFDNTLPTFALLQTPNGLNAYTLHNDGTYTVCGYHESTLDLFRTWFVLDSHETLLEMHAAYGVRPTCHELGEVDEDYTGPVRVYCHSDDTNYRCGFVQEEYSTLTREFDSYQEAAMYVDTYTFELSSPDFPTTFTFCALPN